VLSVLLYSILSVQIVYSVQLNCSDSNYTEAAAICSAAQQHSTFTVQTVQSATELYLLNGVGSFLRSYSAASQEIPRIFGTRRFLTIPTSARHLSLS
jgi:CHASE3 domain sensor protein